MTSDSEAEAITMAFIHRLCKQNNEMKSLVIIRALSLCYTKMKPIQLLTVTQYLWKTDF